MTSDGEQPYTSLRALLAAPKGCLVHAPQQAFLLHVFWTAPSAAAAQRLLGGLARCAAATRRDTPCVPTYFFRVCASDASLCPPPPRTVGEHPQLADARRKLQLGVPPPAVRAHLAKLGLDAALLELPEAAPLPAALQTQAVALEFTELYLDERAFMEHAGSRDYLDGHAEVMNPALMQGMPHTIRIGTPSAGFVERILDPVLREHAVPLMRGCTLWQRPHASGDVTNALLLSLDFDAAADDGDDRDAAAAVLAAALPETLREWCTTCVVFAHPLRKRTTRLLSVLLALPPVSVLEALAALRPARGEVHVACTDEAVEVVRAALSAAGLGAVTVSGRDAAGYILHANAADVRESDAAASAGERST